MEPDVPRSSFSVPQIRPASGFAPATLHGCRSSLATSHAITSTGSSGLNQILNGGVPVGTVVMFEDRPWNLYSRHFLLMFTAEGLAVGHRVSVAAPSSAAGKGFVSDVPKKIVTDKDSGSSSVTDAEEGLRNPFAEGDSMKIAFRYESLPKINPTLGTNPAASTSEPQYDFGRKIDAGQAETVNTFSPPRSLSPTAPSPVNTLLEWLHQETTRIPRQNVLRMCLPEIDSPLWGFPDPHTFFRFLFRLRTLARQNSVIFFLSISSSLHSPADLFRIRRLTDAYLVLETLENDTKNALYRDFQALFMIEKALSVNALRPPVILDCEYGFKIKRRKVTLERLHLPPALPETVQRETSDHTTGIRAKMGEIAGNRLGCQASTERNLDF